jgi:hypothetical protein
MKPNASICAFAWQTVAADPEGPGVTVAFRFSKTFPRRHPPFNARPIFFCESPKRSSIILSAVPCHHGPFVIEE